MFNTKKLIAPIIFSIFFLGLLFSLDAVKIKAAGLSDWSQSLNQAKGNVYTAGQGGDSATEKIAYYVGKILLIAPFLGMILIIRIVWAGYLWISSGGKAEKVEEAKNTIQHAIIGVVILLALYLLGYFIIDRLASATNYNINK